MGWIIGGGSKAVDQRDVIATCARELKSKLGLDLYWPQTRDRQLYTCMPNSTSP